VPPKTRRRIGSSTQPVSILPLPPGESRPAIAVDLRAMVGIPTGIGVYTRAILLELARSGRYRLIGLSHRTVSGAEDLARAGVELDVSPAPLGVVWQQLRFGPRAQALGADLLWSPLQTLPWSPGVPSVVTIHDLTVRLFPETHRQKVLWSQRPFLRRTLSTATAVIAASRATAKDIRFLYPATATDRITVVPLGVDSRFQPDLAMRAQVRAELECAHGYILAAGTLEPRKNLGVLFAAWERLRTEEPNFPPLVLVGASGWKNQAILAEIERLAPQGLLALGRVADERLIELLQGAAVFAYPSLYEGFGLPPLEALACGLPTVVSDVSSLPEVVGAVGFKAPPHDVKAWIQALRQAWLQRNDLALRGRALAWAANFSWRRSAERHAEVFDRVLARRGASRRPGRN
jgi:glycosyltransferase involved in cell wall biosynthesis